MSSITSILWTQKYKPKSLSEVVGNEKAKKEIEKWMLSWEKGIPEKRAIFLYGPPGVGKTCTVEALANDFKMELISSDASTYRTAEAVKRFAGRASEYASIFGAKKLIFFDEIDGIAGTEDAGGLREITEIIRTTRVPIILAANNAWDPKFSALRSHCLLIEFKKPTVHEVVKHLAEICAKEGINADNEALKFIAERSGGDVRSAVIDLQAVAQGRRKITYEDVKWLAYRDRKEEIFQILRMILYAKDVSTAKRAVSMTDLDLDMLFEWIYENVPHHVKNPHELANVMEALAKADVYRKRIVETQDWGFLRYFIDLMSAGVVVSWSRKSSGWIPFRFPERIRMASTLKSERDMLNEIGRRIGRKCHLSSSRAIVEVLPYLRIIFENDPEKAKKIAKWLNLDDEMITYISGKEINRKLRKLI